jgi:predicted DNA-binding transcriptional regulator AlpA
MLIPSIIPADDQVLNDKETAKLCGFSVATLRRQRAAGKGPPIVRLSERRHGSTFGAVRKWLAARTEPVTGESHRTQ